ncbi:MAG: KamA family radical SAM protein, partial [Deltaproteobacteria bacterium]|nr:KamA family radical SAM protein [Deltaproteobacteria bacterium]
MTWKSELKNRIVTADQLKNHIELSSDEVLGIEAARQGFAMAIPEYYASLMDKANPACPIRRQAIPDVREGVVHPGELVDPLGEELDSPVKCITRRYPDRALLLVTNSCFMYCRHCNRRRKVGDARYAISDGDIEAGLRFIATVPEIEDVLISGGDPLFCATEKLDWILKALRKIPHVRTIRIGTRAPVVLPSRITDSLVAVLKKAHPLWLNTHFNHPRELTPESMGALARLADAGIPLGNQSVLLRGVNDCPQIIRELCLKLVENRVRPYYLFQCDLAQGVGHFRTRLSRGIEIMESLIGHIRGYAIPTYAIDPPGGAGKIPILPNYVLSQSDDAVVVRNYEGMLVR